MGLAADSCPALRAIKADDLAAEAAANSLVKEAVPGGRADPEEGEYLEDAED